MLYRDVGYLVTIVLQVLFFLTPITYTLELVPEEVRGIPLRRILELNPMTQFVNVSRDLFYFGRVPAARHGGVPDGRSPSSWCWPAGRSSAARPASVVEEL